MKFTILDADLIAKLPKSRKGGDMRRILESPNSEDYVTWNVFALLKRIPAERWWPRIADLARAQNAEVPEGLSSEAVSAPDLWNLITSPEGYESASRLRMMQSEDEIWRRRVENPRPVEGKSEIDIAIETDESLVFIEAKLGADVGGRTMYDPTRNQIARNIDCLLETANSRKPFFWMIAKNRSPDRNYMKLLGSYSEDPSELKQLLPHRSSAEVETVCRTAAVILWRELFDAIKEMMELSHKGVQDVMEEISRRI